MARFIDVYKLKTAIMAAITGKFEPRLETAKSRLQNQMMQDTSKFVPYDTGRLDMSAEPMGGSGVGIVWTADYAGYVARMPPEYDFNRSVHPEATPDWVGEAVRQYKDKWVHTFEQTLKGY